MHSVLNVKVKNYILLITHFANITSQTVFTVGCESMSWHMCLGAGPARKNLSQYSVLGPVTYNLSFLLHASPIECSDASRKLTAGRK